MGNVLGGMEGYVEPRIGVSCNYCNYKLSSGFGCISPPYTNNSIENKTITKCCDKIVHRDCYGLVRTYLPNCPLCKVKTKRMIPLTLVKYPKFMCDGSIIPMDDRLDGYYDKKAYLFKNILSELDESYEGNSESPFGKKVTVSITASGSSGILVHNEKNEYHGYVKIIRSILMERPEDVELPESLDCSYESSSYNSDIERYSEYDDYQKHENRKEEEEIEKVFSEEIEDKDKFYESMDRIKIKYVKERMIKNAYYDYKDALKYISDDEMDYSKKTESELVEEIKDLKLKNEKLELENEYKNEVIDLLEY